MEFIERILIPAFEKVIVPFCVLGIIPLIIGLRKINTEQHERAQKARLDTDANLRMLSSRVDKHHNEFHEGIREVKDSVLSLRADFTDFREKRREDADGFYKAVYDKLSTIEGVVNDKKRDG